MKKLEVSKEFILEAYSSACPTWKAKLEKEFPTVFVKEELELNRWYKSKNGSLIYPISLKEEFNNAYNYYGFCEGGTKWTDKDWTNMPKNFRLATPQEVETALINEAKRRGFKEGCDFIDVNKRTIKNAAGIFLFNSNVNFLAFCGGAIFDDGKWATIIEQPLTLEQRIENLENQLKQLK